jgi:hypothetical protein
MSAQSGRKIALGLGLETVRGTSVAPVIWNKHLEVDFQQRVEKELNESGLGVLDKFNATDVFKEFATGNISGKAGDVSIGYWLSLAFGAKPTSGDNADSNPVVKDHTFAQSQSNQPLSATIALKDTNRDERYAFASLNNLELSFAVGDWLKFSADLVSKKPATATNTVAYTAENEFKAKHITVKTAANVAGLSGATARALREFKLMVSRNVNEYMAIGSNEPVDFFTQEVEISGDFTQLFDAVTDRDAYLNDTDQVMQVTIVNSDVVIGASANPKLVLTFYKTNFTEWTLDQSLGSMTEQTLGFQSLYSLTDAKSWDAVLTNTLASY